MRKILLVIATALMVMGANASNVEKIQFANAGKFSLGLMAGMPPRSVTRQMPTVSVDAMWGLKDGFCDTKKFGKNGAVDLGLYVGYCHYGFHEPDSDYALWDLPIAVRSAFHWEFVKRLDVYAGLQAGVSIVHVSSQWKDFYSTSEKESVEQNEVEGVVGLYVGAKWMFTEKFGVKIEYSGDYLRRLGSKDNSMPYIAGGVTFNF